MCVCVFYVGMCARVYVCGMHVHLCAHVEARRLYSILLYYCLFYLDDQSLTEPEAHNYSHTSHSLSSRICLWAPPTPPQSVLEL